MELARDTLVSRDEDGTATFGDALRDLHFRENDGILEPIFDAIPLSGDASPRWRVAIGLCVYS